MSTIRNRAMRFVSLQVESLEDRVNPADFHVTNYFDLVFNVFPMVNTNGEDDRIFIDGDITYSAQKFSPEGIEVGDTGKSLTFLGNSPTRKIDAAQLGRLFNVTAGTVKFQNLILTGGQYLAASEVPARGGAILVASGATVDLNGVTVKANTARGGTFGLDANAEGGAIYNFGTLTIANSAFDGNSANGGNRVGGHAEGGAIAGLGTVTINSSVFQANTAVGGSGSLGGPVAPAGFGGNARGGAIAASGPLSIFASLLESNSVTGGVGGNDDFGGPGGFGGSALGAAVNISTTSAVVGNSSVAGNTATGGMGGFGGTPGQPGLAGGAIFVRNGMTPTLASTTVAGNTSAGVYLDNLSHIILYNSLLAQNTGGNLIGGIADVIAADGNYLESSQYTFPSGGTNIVGGTLTLPALANNGTLAIDPAGVYFRKTFALPAGAAAIGIGNNAKLTADLIGPDNSHDGRGNFDRLQGAKTDAGSYEAVAAPTATRFALQVPTLPQIAGATFDVTIQAVDAMNAAVPTYAGTASLASSIANSLVTPGGPITFRNGLATVQVRVPTIGNATLTASETGGTLMGTANVSIVPASLRLSVPTSPLTAGATFTASVEALNADGSPATGYSGSVDIAVTLGGTPLIPDFISAFDANGLATVRLTPRQAGTIQITVTDQTNSALSSSVSREVASALAVGFRFDNLPATTPTANAPFPITVSAVDVEGAVVPGYAGTVTLSSDPAGATFQQTTLTSGTSTVLVRIPAPGTFTLNVTDDSTPPLGGQSPPIIVQHAVVDHYSLTSDKPLVVGVEATLTLTPVDAAGIAVVGVTDSVLVTGTTTTGLPFTIPGQLLVAGSGSFRYTPTEPDTVRFVLTSTSLPALTGTPFELPVAPFIVRDSYQPLGNSVLPDAPGGSQLASGSFYAHDGNRSSLGDEPAVSSFGSPLVISILQVNPNHVSMYLPDYGSSEGQRDLSTISDLQTASLSHYSTTSTGGFSENTNGTVANDFIAAVPSGQISLLYDGPVFTPEFSCSQAGVSTDIVHSLVEVGGTPVSVTTVEPSPGGFPDVVAANPAQGRLNVIRNLGDGSPYFGPLYRTDEGYRSIIGREPGTDELILGPSTVRLK